MATINTSGRAVDLGGPRSTNLQATTSATGGRLGRGRPLSLLECGNAFHSTQVKGENIMSDRKLLPGKFVWFEHVSTDSKKAHEFYRNVLGWNAKPFPMGETTYEMILTGDTWDTMIGGYTAPETDCKP